MKNSKLFSKVFAFILTAAMTFSSFNAEALIGNAFAAGEEKTVNLAVNTKETTAVKNEYGDDVICDVVFSTPDEMSTQAKIDSYTNAKAVVKLTVNNFTTGAKAPSVYLYSMSKDWDHSWKSYPSQQLVKDQQITLEADLKKDMKWESSTEFGKLGIRFVDCAENSAVDYTIDSAQFVYTEGEGGTQNTPAKPEKITSDWTVEDTNVVLAVSNVDEYDFTSYFFTVKNVGSSSVNGNLVVTFDQNRTKNWWDEETAISLENNKLTISNINLSSGSATKSIQVQLRPQGAKITNVTFNGKAIGISENMSTSDVDVKYELTGKTKELAAADTPFGKHGKLKLKKVEGYGNAPVIVDANEKPFMLQGASTHGMHWDVGGDFVNEDSFHSLRDEFGVNMVRLVNYVTQGGYTGGSASTLDSKIETGMAAAKKLGLYAIIDWHIHAENPHTTKEAAKAFWAKYAQKYKDEDYVIYEICNEPTGVQWYTDGTSDLYGYCKEIIDTIRTYDSDAIIVCGTNTWSQDVKDVAGHDFNENGYNNIMYTLHFYSATHGAASSGNYERKLGPEMEQAIAAGTPIFITEFGVCSADGNGKYDTENADAWMALCDKYNISHACWALSNKGEAASYFKTSCSKKTGGWLESDLTTTGAWLINTYRDHAIKSGDLESEGLKPDSSSSEKSDDDSGSAPPADPEGDDSSNPSVKPGGDSGSSSSAKPGSGSDSSSSAKPGSDNDTSATPSSGSNSNSSSSDSKAVSKNPVTGNPETVKPEKDNVTVQDTSSKTQTVIDFENNRTYNGKKQMLDDEFEVTIIDDSGKKIVLRQGKDYKISYKNNKNANMKKDESGKWVNIYGDPADARDEVKSLKNPYAIIKYKGAYKEMGIQKIFFDIYPVDMQHVSLVEKNTKIEAKALKKVKFLKCATVEFFGRTKKLNLAKDIKEYKMRCLTCEENPNNVGKSYTLNESINAPSGTYIIEAVGQGNFYGYTEESAFELVRK